MRKKTVYALRIAAALYVSMCSILGFSETEAHYRKTAVRYIETAKKFLEEENYSASLSQTALGLTFDKSIADLYYIQALALSVQGASPHEIFPALNASLEADWYEYNRDAARLLLADLYVKTGQSAQALDILNEKPALYTTDALYARARALYRLGKSGQARDVIKRAAFQHPDDERFAHLFFDAERIFSPETVSAQKRTDKNAQDLTGLFLSRLNDLEKADPDILLKASIFAQNRADTKRFLRAWNAYGKTDPYYGIYALQYGLLTEEAAFEYMLPFFNGTTDYNCLKSFVSLISSDAVKERLRLLYESFEGTINFDTDKDGIADMTAAYQYGRPLRIDYDKNQDGKKDWEAECDYGVPVKLTLFSKNIVLWYGAWPEAARVICGASGETENCSYDILDNALLWTPFQLISDPVSQIQGEALLHIPVLAEYAQDFPDEDLFVLSHTVERPVDEYPAASVRFNVLHGMIQYAVYSDNETPYAYARFENGILQYRNVDRDRNGTYEIVENYGFDREHRSEYRKKEEAPLSRRLFGPEDLATGLYIHSVVYEDSEAVFTETYDPDGGFSLSKKSRASGGWDALYTRTKENTESIEYLQPFSGKKVNITLEKGVPVLSDGRKVIKDPAASFFWLGEYPGATYAEIVMEKLNHKDASGVIFTLSDVFQFKDTGAPIRIFAVKNGDTYFGEVLHE